MAPLDRIAVVTLGRDDYKYPVPHKQADAILSATLTLERITFNLIQIEGNPRQASRWLCCVSPLIR